MGQAKQRGAKEQRINQAKARSAESSIVRKLVNAQERYATQWEVNSRHFFDSGYYEWMADKIRGQQTLLEIGCGVGYSTLTLAQRGHTVIAIDENLACLEATKERLEQCGFVVEIHRRSTIMEGQSGTYKVTYGQVPDSTSARICLIEGDVLNDPILKQWITQTRKFDAVVCWLLGTHEYRALGSDFNEYGVSDQYGFRILIQNAVYELADEILKPKGILHVVDRGSFIDDPRLIEAIKDSHRDQASVTTLVVEDVDNLPYTESKSIGALMMVSSPPNKIVDGIDNSQQYPALVSVISTKPN